MQLKIMYFASLREALGCDQETVQVPPEVTSAGALRIWLAGRSEAYALALATKRSIRIAVNKRLAQPEEPLVEGAEVAFFPPVTGG